MGALNGTTDSKNTIGADAQARGKLSQIVVPQPGSLAAPTWPPIASTSPFAIASPRPALPPSRLRAGSAR